MPAQTNPEKNIYQRVKKVPNKLLSWNFPVLIEGNGSLSQLPEYIRSYGQRIMLIITDRIQVELGMLEQLLSGLLHQGITYHIYSDTCRDATTDNVVEAAELYGYASCDGIIAFGGASCMSCSKAVAARIAKPATPLLQLLRKPGLRKRCVPIYAVPTVDSSGNEISASAIILDQQSKRRFKMQDHCLIPNAAIIDPALILRQPGDRYL